MPPVHPEQRASAPVHATGAVEFVDLADIAGDETFRVRLDGDVSQLATSLGRLGQLAPVELRARNGMDADGPRWQVVAGFRRLAAVRLLARERVLARLHPELSDDDAWGLALSDALLREPLTAEELHALRDRLRASGVAPWADELIDEALVCAPVAPELREQFFDFLERAGAAPLQVMPSATAPPCEAESEPVVARRDAQPPEPAPAPAPAPAPEPEPEASASPPAVLVVPYEPVVIPPDGAEAAPVEAEAIPTRGEGADDTIEVTPEELVQDLAARLWGLNQDLATAFEAWEDLPAEGRRAIVEQARYVVALLPLMEAKG